MRKKSKTNVSKSDTPSKERKRNVISDDEDDDDENGNERSYGGDQPDGASDNDEDKEANGNSGDDMDVEDVIRRKQKQKSAKEGTKSRQVRTMHPILPS